PGPGGPARSASGRGTGPAAWRAPRGSRRTGSGPAGVARCRRCGGRRSTRRGGGRGRLYSGPPAPAAPGRASPWRRSPGGGQPSPSLEGGRGVGVRPPPPHAGAGSAPAGDALPPRQAQLLPELVHVEGLVEDVEGAQGQQVLSGIRAVVAAHEAA